MAISLLVCCLCKGKILTAIPKLRDAIVFCKVHEEFVIIGSPSPLEKDLG